MTKSSMLIRKIWYFFTQTPSYHALVDSGLSHSNLTTWYHPKVKWLGNGRKTYFLGKLKSRRSNGVSAVLGYLCIYRPIPQIFTTYMTSVGRFGNVLDNSIGKFLDNPIQYTPVYWTTLGPHKTDPIKRRPNKPEDFSIGREIPY